MPSGNICFRIVKISNLKEEGIIEEISYERHAHESVDDRSLF